MTTTSSPNTSAYPGENQSLPSRATSRTRPRNLSVLLCALSMSATLCFAATDPSADNTKRNQNDDAALTPLDQSNDPADIKAVAEIRRALTDDSSLSTNAQNIKVIVRQGVATLRGPVANANEKGRAEQLAKKASGIARVDNQLNVKN